MVHATPTPAVRVYMDLFRRGAAGDARQPLATPRQRATPRAAATSATSFALDALAAAGFFR